jgi:hypothetical protein
MSHETDNQLLIGKEEEEVASLGETWKTKYFNPKMTVQVESSK